MTIPRNKIAQIHIAKAQLGLDDDAYRELLQRSAGVASAKDLTVMTVGKVINELKRLGFKPKAPKTAGRKAPRPPKTRAAVMSKIEAILAEAERPWAYADAMARHMFKIERVDWLDDDQLRRLMHALIYDQRRRQQ